jgi:hypothetical protein
VSGLVITGVAVIVNVCAFDVVPQGLGFTTVTEAVPAVAMREAGTVAVSCVEETYVVVSAVAFHFTAEVETKFVPVTVNVNCEPPAAAQVGLSELIVGTALIVNVTALDVAPHGLGLTTVIEAVPAVAIREAGTAAVSCVDETNVVVSAVAFHFTVEVEAKFVPVTVNVNCEPPAVAQVGLRELIVGTALIVNVTALDVAPHGLGFATVIEAAPAVATREAGTVAVSCVEETNVVVSAVAFHFTVEPETKLVPFTVNVNCGPPAVAQVGLSEPIVGTALIVITSVC